MMKESDNKIKYARRDFLKKSIATTIATVIPTVVMHTVPISQAEPRRNAVTDKIRWGMLINTNQCAEGCTACIDACNNENGLDLIQKPKGAKNIAWDQQIPKWIRQVTVKDNLTGRVTDLPMMCQHCEFPPCTDVCPTGASFRRADGIVMVDRHTCIGCRYCMMACPYNARSFNHAHINTKSTMVPRGKGCVESCNFCAHRLDNGEITTACQDACEKIGHKAIIFGNLNDPHSQVYQAISEHPSIQVRPDLKLNTGVRYSGI